MGTQTTVTTGSGTVTVTAVQTKNAHLSDAEREGCDDWGKACNALVEFEENICPDDVFSKGTKAAVSHWLGRFVMEARRQDGKPYPPISIHMLLMGIQHDMHELTPENKSFELKKLVGLPPPHSNYLGDFLRFRRTFAEVIMFDEASAHEFRPSFKLLAFIVAVMRMNAYYIYIFVFRYHGNWAISLGDKYDIRS